MLNAPLLGGAYRARDPYFSSVVLLVHGNGTNGDTSFPDSSSYARTATAFGNAQTSTAQSKFGGSSMLFDGVGDYVSYPDSNDFSFSAAFTIEAFYRYTSASTNNVIVGKHDNATQREFLLISETNTLKWYEYSGSSFLGGLSSSTTTTTNNWYHAAICFDGTTLRLFLDGNIVATNVGLFGMTNSTTPLTIGGTSAQSFTGNVAEVRITKGVARYTAAFTPPTAAFPNQ